MNAKSGISGKVMGFRQALRSVVEKSWNLERANHHGKVMEFDRQVLHFLTNLRHYVTPSSWKSHGILSWMETLWQS